MSKENKVQIVEKNEGTKINFEQDGTRLFFGDDDIMVNAAKYQRDWPVHLDVCADDNRNLVIGVGTGLYYVAQIDIPPVKYIEVEPEHPAESSPEGYNGPQMEPQPLDMGDVIVTLWSIDDITPVNR